jgi:hypothetical protein
LRLLPDGQPGDGNSMNQRTQQFLVLAAFGACSICALSQTSENTAPHKIPELKLRIIPSKETFAVDEKVFTKLEFTNLSDKTLCFPQPARVWTNDFPGSAVTTGHQGNENPDRFFDHYDGASLGTRKHLLSEIQKHWIKVLPKGKYVTDSAEALVTLSLVGQWKLESTYVYPQTAFGGARARKFLSSTAERAGCTIPTTEATAESVPISVIPAPYKN